jgi:hypothetical protein
MSAPNGSSGRLVPDEGRLQSVKESATCMIPIAESVAVNLWTSIRTPAALWAVSSWNGEGDRRLVWSACALQVMRGIYAGELQRLDARAGTPAA